MKSNKDNKSNKSNKDNKSNNNFNGHILENSPENATQNKSITLTFITSITGAKTISDKVKCLLFVEPKQTLKEISEKIDIEKEKVKTIVLQQNKEFFEAVDKIGKENVYSLSEKEREYIDFLIKQKEKQEAREKEGLLEKEQKSRKDEKILLSIKNILLNMKDCYEIKSNKIIFDLNEILPIEADLIEELENRPEEIINLFEQSIKDSVYENFFFSFKNYDAVFNKKIIENLRAEDLNHLLVIKAKSTLLSDVRPQVVNARFECPTCGTIISILQLDKKFKEPNRCSCGRRGSFKLLGKDMSNVSKVIIEDLQELSKSISQKRINAFIKEPLTNTTEIEKFNPGNDLKLLGILKEVPILLRTGGMSTRSDFAIEIIQAELFEPEISMDDFTEEQIKKFNDLSKNIDENGFDAIRGSIAPQIYGYEEIKDAIIIQAGQPRNTNPDMPRNKSNILLIGDPGTSKSISMKFVEKITPQSIFTSGSGSSHVGLTATVEKNDDGWALKPGCLVLAKELLLIDELNNLDDEDKPKLQEGMSEQKITISKATIHTSLKVSCGIFAGANPIHGTFNENENLIKQFNLPPQIINRFDLIFLIKDNVEKDKDKKIAMKMMQRERGKIISPHNINFLRKFFLYIRNQPEPKFDDGLSDFIADLYSQLRVSLRTSNEVSVNPRFVEAIIRGAKSSARLRLSKKIERKDILRIYNILKNTYYKLSFEFNENLFTK